VTNVERSTGVTGRCKLISAARGGSLDSGLATRTPGNITPIYTRLAFLSLHTSLTNNAVQPRYPDSFGLRPAVPKS
jgi:hypothetical protein